VCAFLTLDCFVKKMYLFLHLNVEIDLKDILYKVRLKELNKKLSEFSTFKKKTQIVIKSFCINPKQVECTNNI
jgi:hypothetical protein